MARLVVHEPIVTSTVTEPYTEEPRSWAPRRRPYLEEEAWAASGLCRCGRNITYQGAGVWAHDSGMTAEQWWCPDLGVASPVDVGVLVRCPPDELLILKPRSRRPSSGWTLGGCGSTFIQQPGQDGFVACPFCSLEFDPTHHHNQPQPPEV